MSRKKKRIIRARKVRSHGLWIAPDLERKIKGEGGRRGLSDPPYSYYLQLADLVLGPSTEALAATRKPAQLDRQELSQIQEKSAALTSANTPPSLDRGMDSIPLTPMPVVEPPKRPKLALPKPQPPKRAKLLAQKPTKRPQHPKPPKLSRPKPPKRGR